jgi:hypothetical protein
VSFSSEQSSRFITAAMDAAKASDLEPELDTVKKAATEFTKNFINHAITSKTALESLFTDADLAFNFLEYHSLNKKGELSGPSVPSDAEFAHVIAEISGR